MSDLSDLLKPHVKDIMRDAHSGDVRATEIIQLYELHRNQPNDPGAVGLCSAAFDAWKKKRKEYAG